jgi:hypothetical protein
MSETLMIATKRPLDEENFTVDLYKLKEDWFWEYLRLYQKDAF